MGSEMESLLKVLASSLAACLSGQAGVIRQREGVSVTRDRLLSESRVRDPQVSKNDKGGFYSKNEHRPCFWSECM